MTAAALNPGWRGGPVAVRGGALYGAEHSAVGVAALHGGGTERVAKAASGQAVERGEQEERGSRAFAVWSDGGGSFGGLRGVIANGAELL